MSDKHGKSVEQRLDDLGGAWRSGGPILDEGAAFLGEVRRRGRREGGRSIAWRAGWLAGLGIAAVLLLTVLIDLPNGGGGGVRPPVGPLNVRNEAGVSMTPTIGRLNLAAFRDRAVDGLPVLPSRGGGTGSWGERPLTPGAMYSREVTDALLDAM